MTEEVEYIEPQNTQVDKIHCVLSALCSVKPIVSYGEEQKFENVWTEEEQETIKLKLLTLIRDL